MRWNAVILGPEDSIWEGGTFKLTFQFTEDYPNKPPTVRVKVGLWFFTHNVAGEIRIQNVPPQYLLGLSLLFSLPRSLTVLLSRTEAFVSIFCKTNGVLSMISQL